MKIEITEQEIKFIKTLLQRELRVIKEDRLNLKVIYNLDRVKNEYELFLEKFLRKLSNPTRKGRLIKGLKI
jgi:hypothetical protein